MVKAGPRAAACQKAPQFVIRGRELGGDGIVAWHICSMSPNEPRNWALCKEFGLFGYTRGMPKCEPGDHLLFWLGQRGYIAYGLVTDFPRVPLNRSEAPWAGGTYRFTAVVPMKVLVEVKNPIHYGFVDNVQAKTGLNTGHLQRSISLMSSSAASTIAAELLDRFLSEEDLDEAGAI